MDHEDIAWLARIRGEGGWAGDLSGTGSDLTPAFGAGLLLLLGGLSLLGSDAEHCSSSLCISPSAPLLWSKNWAKERTSCRTAIVLKQLCTTLVEWRYSLGHFEFFC